MARKRRRYRYTWDQVPWMDCDWISRPGWGDDEDAPRKGGGAFDGYSGEMGTSGVEITAHVEHDKERDVFGLYYTPAGRNAANPVRAKVQIERRPQARGGARVYFRCPCCRRSVRKLALLENGVMCAHLGCGSIQQPSRRKGVTQRLVNKADMLAGRIGCGAWYEPPKERPKGMHRKTFEALATRHAAAVRDAMRVIGPRLARAQARGAAAYIGALVRAGM
jgi:hypothetical protein